MLSMYNVLAFVALHILFVKGQLGPQPVAVGLQGSFYSPQTISVAVNNSVTFEFFGDIHSVTQSSFADPCAPLPGGFHSGFLGMGPNNSLPVKVWNLVVTDVSQPIWYFCAITSPVFHCTVGMVGVINPPSQAAYTSFSVAAKLITTTPSINPTPTLQGIGAFASSTPTISAISVTPSVTPTPGSSLSTGTPTSTSTSTSSTSASPTATTSSTSPNLGAIVGGTVGGSVALIAFIISLWYFCLRNKQAPVTAQNDDFFRYNPVPARRPNEVFTETTGSGTFNHIPSTMSHTNTSTVQTARLTPLRRPSGPVILEPPYLHRQTSQQSDLNSTSSNPTTSGRNFSEPSNNVDIRALAQEVAAVLYQNPAKAYPSQDTRGQMSVQNHDDDRDATTSQVSHQPPPNYRAATGPSSSMGHPGKAQYP